MIVTKRPIIVGMNDPTNANPRLALSPDFPGSSGQRLCQVAGMTAAEFKAAFERINVVESRKWPGRRAAKFGAELRDKLDGRRVFVLGREAWQALGFPKVDFLSTVDGWTLLPHPSGLNHYYNDPTNRAAVGRILRGVRP